MTTTTGQQLSNYPVVVAKGPGGPVVPRTIKLGSRTISLATVRPCSKRSTIASTADSAIRVTSCRIVVRSINDSRATRGRRNQPPIHRRARPPRRERVWPTRRGRSDRLLAKIAVGNRSSSISRRAAFAPDSSVWSPGRIPGLPTKLMPPHRLLVSPASVDRARQVSAINVDDGAGDQAKPGDLRPGARLARRPTRTTSTPSPEKRRATSTTGMFSPAAASCVASAVGPKRIIASQR